MTGNGSHGGFAELYFHLVILPWGLWGGGGGLVIQKVEKPPKTACENMQDSGDAPRDNRKAKGALGTEAIDDRSNNQLADRIGK